MEKDFINLDQISRKVARDYGLGFNQSVKIITAVNNHIAQGLKLTSKVRLHDFGIFYVRTLKSRSIYQIRTGQKRLLLEKAVIKFKTGPTFKNALNGTVIPKQRPYQPKAKTPQKSPESKNFKIKVETAHATEIKPAQGTIPVRERPIDLVPIKIMDRVDPIRARETIRERLKKLARKSAGKSNASGISEIFDLSQSASGRLFAALFRQINSSGGNGIHFVLTSRDLTDIFYGRPKKKISQIPTKLASDFLERYLELVDFDIPQERFVKVYSSGNIITSFSLSAHSLPTSEGASIYLRIERIS